MCEILVIEVLGSGLGLGGGGLCWVADIVFTDLWCSIDGVVPVL